MAAFASGCGTRTLQPEPVRLDRAHCAYCDMIVSDEANAAQAVSRSEDTRFYDDIGCLALDRAAHAAGARLFARAAGRPAWIAVDEAWFARSARLRTPMGHGIGAHSTEDAARSASDEGRALRWADLVSHVASAR